MTAGGDVTAIAYSELAAEAIAEAVNRILEP